MSITAHINTMDYNVENNDIYIYCRDVSTYKPLKIIIQGFEPYIYILESAKTPENDGIARVETNILSFDEKALKKLVLTNTGVVDSIRKHVKTTYEGDVPFVRRFLLDKKIYSGIIITKYSKTSEGIVCWHTDVKPADTTLKPLIDVFDVEVNSVGRKLPDPEEETAYLNCVTCWNSQQEHYITFFLTEKTKRWSMADNHTVIPCKTEKKLLKNLKRYYDRIKPDLIGGWNVNFDKRFIIERGKRYGIRFDFSNTRFYDFLGGYTRLSNKKLGKRLKEVVIAEGIAKEEDLVSSEYHNELWEDPKLHDQLIEYNKDDVEYPLKIDKMYNIIDFFWRLKSVTGLENIDATQHFNTSIDTDYLRESGSPLPTREEVKDLVKIVGAYVIQPEPGIYPDVVVLDFSKFYPSLLIAYNLSAELMHLSDEDRLKHPLGLTPRVCLKLIKERAYWDQRLDEILKDKGPDCKEYKIAKLQRDTAKFRLNAVYGYGIYKKSRIYSPACMSYMLDKERKFIKFIEEIAKKFGYKIIYGDTDSIMGQCKPEDIPKFEKLIQNAIDEYCKRVGIKNEWITIKAERYADKGVWIRKKGDKKGAKKRYILHVTKEYGDEGAKECDYLYTKGIDMIRGDQSKVTKNVQEKLIKAIFNETVNEEIARIREIISKIQKNKYSYDEIAIRSNIKRKFEDYKANRPEIRGSQYSNDYCDTHIGKNDFIKMLFVKTIPGMPRTNVICYQEKDTLPKNLEIDTEWIIQRTVTGKIETLLEVCGYSVRDLKNIKGVESLL